MPRNSKTNAIASDILAFGHVHSSFSDAESIDGADGGAMMQRGIVYFDSLRATTCSVDNGHSHLLIM